MKTATFRRYTLSDYDVDSIVAGLLQFHGALTSHPATGYKDTFNLMELIGRVRDQGYGAEVPAPIGDTP